MGNFGEMFHQMFHHGETFYKHPLTISQHYLTPMFTYKFLVNPRDNALRLRISNNRKKAEIGMGFNVHPDFLENAMSEMPDKSNIKLRSSIMAWNVRIEDVRLDLMDSGREDADVKEIKELIQQAIFGSNVVKSDSKAPTKQRTDGKTGFTSHFQTFIDAKTNKGTKGVYQHTLDRIRLHDPDIDLKSFEDIDLKWLVDFEAFCAKTASKNARNIHLRNIRAVFNNAIDYELTTAYPFRRFKIRPEATRKRSLSVEELRRLFDYPVEPYAELYRDMFKLIFMLIGINTVDLYGLKCVSRDGYIEYKRAKTGRLYSIKVEPEALEIINRYKGKSGLLCIADRWNDSRNFRHQCNKALQKIGQVERRGRGGKKIITAEFEGLTTYWARHTWATIARSLKVPKDDIALALGHGSKTVTDIYIDEDLSAVDEANRRVLDWVLYGKR